MTPSAFAQYATQYRDNLLNDVIPFWQRFSPDQEHGGFFTCLDRTGKVYDTDKFIWLQARQVWTFSMLYNRVGSSRPELKADWLAMAQLGADFLMKHGRAEDGSWYFSTTREGKPLVQPYNIFSDCFATMAFGQLSLATGNDEQAHLAESTFRQILARRENPKGAWKKAVPGTRPLKNFALPMILCNLALEIEHLLDKPLVEQTIDECIHEVMTVFFDPDLGLIRENVTPDGHISDSFDGRLLNPGHAIEAMWFIMDLAVRMGDRSLLERAVQITLDTLAYAWDTEHGGILYFMDANGCPPQQLEWDQKLWWVHVETLISLLKGYQLTGNQACWEWFERVHAYTWSRFPDPSNGEWFGYLNRRGEVLLPLKGGKWKGCYHVPRALYQCWQVLDKL
ncbi:MULTISPECIES: AGE family epimerase/isomerase [unclassified Spirosoma]|uniref:AGE family epimerase/isomerase n=1 Tax=unclassified Spirosoma TaxID=2621999 RepID=UPI00095E3A88|nr:MULTISPECIES: AGE family epimerase/isomerase [unclassified Spirosoma]MBN8825459.1 AGE family epimerase/isomerase [Spirosoma sp.]OJW74969.1 MAG: N-acylglucosamine 2-epimerase [Spirosoma sp. 48-14]